jgi:hypothetical protein
MDVILLEKVYLKLRPWIKNHPNLGIISSSRGVCPNCHSSDLMLRGFGFNKATKYRRMQCQGCGAWVKGDVIKLDKRVGD